MFVPSRLEDAFTLNYDLQSQIFKDQLNGWKHGTVSWTGRINVLKRNVLCKISYLFHQLPADTPGKQVVPLKAKGWNTTEGLNAILFLN